jgi:ABC-type phosphonate transport system ATPase subunit
VHPERTSQREPAESTDVLELGGLTRRYGDLVALDDLSFTVAEGQMFGVVPHEVEVREPGTQPASLMS